MTGDLHLTFGAIVIEETMIAISRVWIEDGQIKVMGVGTVPDLGSEPHNYAVIDRGGRIVWRGCLPIPPGDGPLEVTLRINDSQSSPGQPLADSGRTAQCPACGSWI